MKTVYTNILKCLECDSGKLEVSDWEKGQVCLAISDYDKGYVEVIVKTGDLVKLLKGFKHD